MGFKEGQEKKGGRAKGTPNKSTAEIRDAYQKLVEDNLTNMTEWLVQVAAENPERAMDLMLKLSEYMIPKLARQEVTGADGKDLFKNITFEFGTPINERDE
jgi:hypothetical protein